MIEPIWVYRAATVLWLVCVVWELVNQFLESDAQEPPRIIRPTITYAVLISVFAVALAFVLTGRLW